MCFTTLIPNIRQALDSRLSWSPETHFITDVEDPKYPDVRPVRSIDYPEGGEFQFVNNDDDIAFVTSKKRVGILPEILQHLLSERKRVKKLRQKYGEKSMDYAVLDGRQLALKVCANSVYGFTGATLGYLPEKRIASSVTRVGRGMANRSKAHVEKKYKEHNLKVIYGDTDSIFVHAPKSLCDGSTPEKLKERADELGYAMEKDCTELILPPNVLEYEKHCKPLLLKGKKRYAGFKFEPGLSAKLDVKGFECVRRDSCPLVSETQKKVLVKLIQEDNPNGAIQFARDTIVQLLEGKIPVEKLIISKQ